MSVAVAVLSNTGAAIATDSIYVDLQTSTMRTGHVKHVKVNDRIGALTGTAGVLHDSQVLGWVRDALSTAPTLDGLPKAFIEAAGPDLKDVFHAWWDATNGSPVEDFINVLVVGKEEHGYQAAHLYASNNEGELEFRVSPMTPSGTEVMAVGAVDDDLTAHTREGHLAVIMARTMGTAPRYPTVAALEGDLSSAACEALAHSLVEARVERDPEFRESGRLPAWWPASMPTVSPPTHSESL